MKKLIVFFALLLFLFPKAIFSQDKSSSDYYTELLQNYRRYQNLVEPFNTQKSRYLAYGTVTTQADFLDASRTLILAEIETINSYVFFIKSLLAEATQILKYDENYLYVQLDDESSFLKISKEKAQNLSSLEDTGKLMTELSAHYQKICQIAFQTKSIIVLGSANKVFDNLEVESGKISSILSELSADTSKIKAAKEKFSELDKEESKTAELLKAAEVLQKNGNKQNFRNVSEEIQSYVDQAIGKVGQIIAGYNNILFSLK